METILVFWDSVPEYSSYDIEDPFLMDRLLDYDPSDDLVKKVKKDLTQLPLGHASIICGKKVIKVRDF